MNDLLTRPYPIRVRPCHLETEASYTKRLLAANTETEDHKKHLLRLAVKSADHGSPVSWRDLLAAKTGREFHFSTPSSVTEAASGDHACNYCPDSNRTRFMCLQCTHGAVVTQATPFSSPVCARHGRWVGPTPEIRVAPHQPTVTAETARAGLRFKRLTKQGRLTPALLTVLRETIRPKDFTTAKEALDAAALPLVTSVAGAVTTKTFIRQVFAPGLTYASAFRRLHDTVTRASDEERPDITLAMWAYLKPTFWALRHASRTGSPYTPAWQHDYVVNADIAMAYVAEDTGESFSHYLAAPEGAPLELSALPFLDRNGMTICAEGHHIKATKKCPVCNHTQVAAGYNDLATIDPTVASQLDPDLNGSVNAQTLAAASHKDVAWRCPRKGHVYWATVTNRTQGGTKCPICSNRTVVPGINDIATTHPHIAAELEPEYALGHPATSMSAGSGKKPLWVCPKCRGIYKMSVFNRTQGSGCDPCRRAALRASRDNLTVTHPEIAALWHFIRNNDKRPDEYTYGSRETVWWTCPTDAAHYYSQRIDRKVRGYGCSACSRRTLVLRVNDLATTDPLLSLEFHPYRNGTKAPDMMVAGEGLYWWTCDAAGHETRQSIVNRRKSKGCVDCPPERRILADNN